MNIIELDAYEKKDLITYLEYAKSHYYLEKPDKKFDTRYYNINRIEHLIDCINGKVKRGGIYSSSYETIEKIPTQKEKQEIAYRRKFKKLQQERRVKALRELEEQKKKERDLVKEYFNIWKD